MFETTGEWDDVEEILRSCETGFIPCNANGDAAIEAHRLAWARYLTDPTEKAAKLVRYALHAVLCATPRTSSEAGAVLEYFRDLPSDAWQLNAGSATPEQYREFALKDAAETLRWRAT